VRPPRPVTQAHLDQVARRVDEHLRYGSGMRLRCEKQNVFWSRIKTNYKFAECAK
jgi:hypothetical protein